MASWKIFSGAVCVCVISGQEEGEDLSTYAAKHVYFMHFIVAVHTENNEWGCEFPCIASKRCAPYLRVHGDQATCATPFNLYKQFPTEQRDMTEAHVHVHMILSGFSCISFFFSADVYLVKPISL